MALNSSQSRSFFDTRKRSLSASTSTASEPTLRLLPSMRMVMDRRMVLSNGFIGFAPYGLQDVSGVKNLTLKLECPLGLRLFRYLVSPWMAGRQELAGSP